MFKVLYKIVDGDNLIGLRCSTPAGTKDFDINYVRTNINLFDIRSWGNGFRFRDSSKLFSNLSVIDIKQSKRVTQSNKYLGINAFTGNSLINLCSNYLVDIKAERDFVNSIRGYINSTKFNKVISICGLRGVGKTVGLLQVIRSLNCYEDIVFLNITKEVDCLVLKEYIDTYLKKFKYIFIDEITLVKKFLTDSSFLHDVYTSSGYKIVISGTDSLALIESTASALHHRVLNINCTYISYLEAYRTCGMTFKEYLTMGGLYKSNELVDMDGLREYIDTAIVSNICNSVSRSSIISSTSSIVKLSQDMERLKSLIFKVLYSIVYTHTLDKKDNTISIASILNKYNLNDTSTLEITRLICDEFGLDAEFVAKPHEIKTVLNILRRLGILVRIENIVKRTEYNYYITNPSIFNLILNSIVNYMKDNGYELSSKFKFSGKRGLLFESIVICYTVHYSNLKGYTCYYYHDKSNREIDLIVGQTTDLNDFETKFYCYEIKLTSSIDTAVLKSKWIQDGDIYNFLSESGEVLDRSIIYGGKENKRFDGVFSETDIFPPKGMTLEEIASKNFNVRLIPVLDYFKGINNILKF